MTRVSVVSLRGKRESNLRARVRLRVDGVIDTEPASGAPGVWVQRVGRGETGECPPTLATFAKASRNHHETLMRRDSA